eukprot:TRINITY_DN13867_c0_g1_i1.p1 TRINITY_DN13867_c0_g1~~TRINITY_DN13867_c0_g1_i1.p1  ORF type:complete len:320 (+),score=107.89 TRINITY_DN13867_c0_g1_i1:115-1074(+)
MLLSLELRDVLPFVLQQLSELKDISNVDLTCSTLKTMNENGGWKTFGNVIMGIPASYFKDFEGEEKKKEGKDNKNCTWKSLLLKRVRPIYLQLIQICNVNSLRKRAMDSVASSAFKQYNPDLCERYERMLREDTFPPQSQLSHKILSQKDWPLDVAIFIACHCYLAQAPCENYRCFLGFGYEDSDEDSTESFAFFDSFGLGGGDTQWWAYVVLKGSVKVPLAPIGYSNNKKRGEPIEIGRGGIVAFSHWNHGGIQTTPKHIYPNWDSSEFGFDQCEYEQVCDEWVRINLEEPVGASRDSLPCGWLIISDFLSEIQRCRK